MATLTETKLVTVKHHDGVEFVVHTKHTCDKCFQRPILGQRFTSGTKSNFDLCARCYEEYTGPDIGLMEAVLVRDNKISHDFVLKLKIDNGGDGQVRRMKVAEIWDKSSSILSYSKLLSIAAGFAVLENESFVANAKVTYIDEDGDEVNISSDNELKDAFLQVIAMLPVRKPFLITVTAPKTEGKGKTENKATGMPKRIQLKKMEPAKRVFSVSMDKPPTVLGCKGNAVLRITPKDFENQSFVHARHTCDGCSMSPIIGTRYHATKIPDFDLCTSCYKEYEGGDRDFTPEIQGRDLRMQQKWLKHWAASEIPCNIAGLTDLVKKVQKSEETPVSNEVAPGIINESFLSDADGNGSIAAVIGRTLDVCVAAIEELQKTDLKDNTVTAAANSSDTVASSVASCVVDDAKNQVDATKSGELDTASSVLSMPSIVTVENVLKSEDCNKTENGSEIPMVEDACSEEDGWSVVPDDN